MLPEELHLLHLLTNNVKLKVRVGSDYSEDFTTIIGIMPAAFVFATVGAGLGSLFDSGEQFSAAAILTPKILLALVGLAALVMLPVAYKNYKSRQS